MQTAAIRHRVADFLRQYPPFSFFDDADLLALVNQGRVKFHEAGEFLCWQNAAHGPHLFVIQQGSVSLWDESGGGEVLRDIHGPGDIVGVERFLGVAVYPYSAKSNCDVIVYALPAVGFSALLEKYPAALRHVQGHAAPGALYRELTRRGVHEQYVVEHVAHPAPVCCDGATRVAAIARMLNETGMEAVAVMNGPELQGTVSARELIRWIAEGAAADRTAAQLMKPAPPAAGPHTTVADCVLSMAQARTAHVALTADGTARGGLLHLVSATDLQPAFGDNPLWLLREIAAAGDIESLRLLHLRARALLLAQLEGPGSVDWLNAFAHQLNVAIVDRLAGWQGLASGERCWCFWNAAGRAELLTAAMPPLLLICRDASDAEAGEAAVTHLRRDLAHCGYINHPDAERLLCGTLADWQERFHTWINDPLQSELDQARPLFDLCAASGSADLCDSLRASIRTAIAAQPSFRMMLANDCLGTLPPLTFFEDAVIEEGGERAGVFSIAARAIDPIVEVGRVFSLAAADPPVSTLARLAYARAQLPAQDAAFREAAETFRVLLYLQARAGLRTQTLGSEILPAHLSRQDRRALTAGFRSIHRLLEFTLGHFWKATA